SPKLTQLSSYCLIGLVTLAKTGFLLARVGEKVKMRCTYEGNEPAWICWYMQTLGQKPKLMSSMFEFKNNLKMSDSATYYCALSYKQVLYFGKGTTVSVKGPGFNIQASVHQLESETIQPGASVTLNCLVQIDSCDGEHNVYWFRNSEESQPGLIYTYGSRKDQCMSNSSTKSQICVHSLSMKNLNASHTATYYCAVASCGHVVFGNGTKLSLSCKYKYFVFQSQILNADKNKVILIHYASINVDHSNRSRRQRSSTATECIYSKISQDK
uniref:Ig-like domain-containing protein n=1 Tax=Poecilia latipinna TaxID=48699 RepID=A0A3B3V933_9TELE